MGITFRGARRPVVLRREDWALLSLAAASGKRLLPVQLQKSLYLLGQQFPRLIEAGFYEFRSIGNEHFSEEVYADTDAMLKSGLVWIVHSDREGWRHYGATAAGRERARGLEKQLSPEVVRYVHRVVAWVSTRSVDQLLRGSPEPTAPAPSDPRKLNPLPPR
ncbi:MAG TPA: hypothetical protein VGK70_04505 [Thermoanaerobaculia bacterium]